MLIQKESRTLFKHNYDTNGTTATTYAQRADNLILENSTIRSTIMNTQTQAHDNKTRTNLKENREKNYAPIDPRIKLLDKSDDNKKYLERQRKRQQVNNHTIPSGYNKTSINFLEAKAAKRIHRNNAIEGYNNRHKKSFMYTKFQNSTFMNPHQTPLMTLNDRVFSYNKRHMCEHRKGYNLIFHVPASKRTGVREYYYLSCNHDRLLVSEIDPIKCIYCQKETLFEAVVERKPGFVICHCDVHYCTHCRKTLFKRDDTTTLYDTCDKTNSTVFYFNETTTKKWAKPSSKKKFNSLDINNMFTPQKEQELKPVEKVYTLEEAMKKYPAPPKDIPQPPKESKIVDEKKLYTLQEAMQLFGLEPQQLTCEPQSGEYPGLCTLGEVIPVIKMRLPSKHPYWTKDEHFHQLMEDFPTLKERYMDFYIMHRYFTCKYFMEIFPPQYREHALTTYGPLLRSRFGKYIDIEEIISTPIPHLQELTQFLMDAPRAIDTEPQSLGSAVDTISGIGSKISSFFLETLQSVINKIKSVTSEFITYIGKEIALARLKGFFDRITFILEHLLEYYSKHLFLLAPLLINFYDLMTTPLSQSLLRWISVTSMLCDACSTISEAYHHKFSTKKPSQRMKGETKKRSFSSLVRHLYSKIQDLFTKDTTATEFQIKNLDTGSTVVLTGNEEQSGTYDKFKDFTQEQFDRFKAFIMPICSYLDIVPKYYDVFFSSIKAFSAFALGVKSLEYIVKHFSSIMPSFINKIFLSANTKDYLHYQLKQETSVYREAMEASIALKLGMLRGDGDELTLLQLKNYAGEKYARLMTYIRTNKIPYDGELASFVERLERYNYAPSITGRKKDEPFTILFSGEPGIGKSHLVPSIVSAIVPSPSNLTIEEKKEYIDKLVFVRNSMTETWDGYVGQPVIQYDDLGQLTEGSDMIEIIALKTQAMFFPPYASIDPKDANTLGTKGRPADPKIVIACTNMSLLSTNTVTNLQALNRRFDCKIIGRYNRDYGVGMARPDDNSHITLGYEKEKASLNEPREVIYFTGTYKEQVKSMLKYVRSQYKKHLDRRAKAEQSTEQFLDTNFDDDIDFNDDKSELTRLMKIAYAAKQDELDTIANKQYISEMTDAPFVDCESQQYESLSEMAIHLLDRAKMHLNNCFNGHTGILTGLGLGMLIKYFISGLPKVFKYLKNISATIIILAGGITIIRTLSRTIKTEQQSGEGREKGKNRQQIIYSEGQSKELHEILTGNIVRISKSYEGTTTVMSAVFIAGNIILLPEHFFLSRTGPSKFMPENTQMWITSHSTAEKIPFVFDPKNIYEIRTSKDQKIDAVLYRLPKAIAPRKTITHHFTDASFKLKNRPITLAQFSANGPIYTNTKITADNLEVRYKQVEGRQVEYRSHGGFMYDFYSSPGDCGSPIFIRDGTAIRGSILGMHVAGHRVEQGTIAVALIVTRSMLESTLRTMNDDKPIVQIAQPHEGMVEATSEDLERSKLKGQILLRYTTTKEIVPPFDCKEIQKSPLFDKITKHYTAPVNMRSGIDLYANGINKYKEPSHSYDKEHIKIVCNHLKRRLYGLETSAPRTTISQFEAMNGTFKHPYIDRFDYSTSAGYPFYGQKKEDLCILRDQDYYPTEELQVEIDKAEEMLARRIIPTDPHLSSLKVERRPLKYDDDGNQIHKARLFSIGPFALQVLIKKYFGGFFSHILQTRGKHFCMVGMRKETEFDSLARKHLAINDKHEDFDYKEFDGRKDQEILEQITELLTDFFTDNDEECYLGTKRAVRHTILSWIFQGNHQYRRYILAPPGALPSGVNLTELLQCIDNAFQIRLAYLSLVPHPYKTMMDFDNMVADSNYGDDLILTISQMIAEHFNGNKIALYLKDRGVTITPGKKTDTEFIPRPITDITFLKCYFTKINGYYYPKMELQALLETINWIRVKPTSDTPEELCESNCLDVSRGLFYHGREIYEEYWNKIIKERPLYNIPTYDEYNLEFRDKGMLADLSGIHTLGRHDRIMKIDYYSTIDNPFTKERLGDVDNIDEHTPIMTEQQMEIATQYTQELVGVEIINQKAPNVIKTDVVEHNVAKYINPETPFNLAMSLQRFTKFADIQVDTATAPGETIQMWTVIQDMLTGSNYYPFKQFLRWRCDNIKIEIQVTGCPFSSGKDILVFFPTMAPMSSIVKNFDLVNALMLPHVAINPASNTTATFTIPTAFYKYWLDIQADQFGQLVLMRQNPFAIGSGPATYNIKLFVSIENADFILPAGVSAPKLRNRMVNTLRPTSSRSITTEPQMATTENTDLDDMETHTFAVGSGVSRDTDPAFFGEKYISYQDELKRQQPLKISGTVKNYEAGKPIIDSHMFGGDLGTHFGNKIASMFRCVKAPRRYVVKVSSHTSGWDKFYGYVTYYPGWFRFLNEDQPENVFYEFFKNGTSNSTLPYAYFDQDTLAEIEIPYNNITPMGLLKKRNILGENSYIDEVAIVVCIYPEGISDTAELRYSIDYSCMFADESQYAVFLGMPVISSITPSWPDKWPGTKKLDAEPQSGLVSGLIDEVAGGLKTVVEGILPPTVTGLVQDTIGAFLDAPNVPTAPEVHRLKKRGYYSNTNQVVMMEKLNGDPSSYQPLDKTVLGVDENPLLYSTIARRKYYRIGYPLKTTEAAGTLLYFTQVGPMLMNIPQPGVIMSGIDFVAQGKTFWRGGIEFEVEVVCSDYDQFKLEATFAPDTNAIPTYEKAVTQYYKSWLIKGTNNRIRFVIPHFADTPWKRVYQGSNLTDSGSNGLKACDFSHGMFCLWLGSSVSSPTTTPNIVYVNVYYRAAPDFEVAVSSLVNTSIDLLG